MCRWDLTGKMNMKNYILLFVATTLFIANANSSVNSVYVFGKYTDGVSENHAVWIDGKLFPLSHIKEKDVLYDVEDDDIYAVGTTRFYDKKNGYTTKVVIYKNDSIIYSFTLNSIDKPIKNYSVVVLNGNVYSTFDETGKNDMCCAIYKNNSIILEDKGRYIVKNEGYLYISDENRSSINAEFYLTGYYVGGNIYSTQNKYMYVSNMRVINSNIVFTGCMRESYNARGQAAIQVNEKNNNLIKCHFDWDSACLDYNVANNKPFWIVSGRDGGEYKHKLIDINSQVVLSNFAGSTIESDNKNIYLLDKVQHGAMHKYCYRVYDVSNKQWSVVWLPSCSKADKIIIR